MRSRRLALAVFSLFAVVPLSASAQPPEDQAAVAKVREAGGQVLAIAQTDDRLDVAFHLGGKEVTPDALKSLAAVKGKLAQLNLRGTNLNDALAADLKPLTELTRLHLEKTAITDAALPHLSEMKKLEYLNLYGTNVTDAGLSSLAGLTGLKQLYVWETKVTPAGVAALRAQIPGLRVYGLPEPPPKRWPIEADRPKPPEPPKAEEKKDEPKK